MDLIKEYRSAFVKTSVHLIGAKETKYNNLFLGIKFLSVERAESCKKQETSLKYFLHKFIFRGGESIEKTNKLLNL